MYATRVIQFASSTLTMACTVQKQSTTQTMTATAMAAAAAATAVSCGTGGSGQRGSLPTSAHQPPLDEFTWPPTPVSMHTSNLRMNMMNQDPKDLHTARLIIEELRTKVRYQTEHIMKWRKAYAMQIQQHYRYQKEKSDQMNALTSQLLLLESRLKRKQKQIANLLNHREQTIQRQQKVIDTLSGRLVDHGLETIETINYATELDSLNDSDSAVVLEDIDSDSTVTFGALRRRSSGGGGTSGDGITIVRSISDAIETNLNKYGGVRRNNCFLRRPEILETVYSVEEDPEPTSDVAEKRDKFKQRSEKALSSSSTEGQIDNAPSQGGTSSGSGNGTTAGNTTIAQSSSKPPQTSAVSAGGYQKTKDSNGGSTDASSQPRRQLSSTTPLQRQSPIKDGYTACSMRVPQLQRNVCSANGCSGTTTTKTTSAAAIISSCSIAASDVAMIDDDDDSVMNDAPNDRSMVPKSQVTNYNRVMSNHRSVTKPKDVKYKRINKAKSKSLEELRGRLKNLVERGNTMESSGFTSNGYTPNIMPPTAQSYA